MGTIGKTLDARKDRLTRADWVAGALRLLAEKGAAAVGVEPLAARLGVTKGSFYWHFRDLAELHAAMRAEWTERSTEYFIKRVTETDCDARARLVKLLQMTSNRPSQLERAMRAWAVTNADTAAHVAGVDLRRTEFVAALLMEIGHDALTAAAYARLTASFVIGQMMSGLEGDERYNAIIAAAVLNPRK
jgi:AcrR family transcriptional regulator